ncbi:MAG: 50S ribosomal protein L11 methyltransferase, partial [Dissulfurimicrobium sp.]|uniref:50S ribosomal protein L11 methyltransferase n=1 Tax=Dissulfurimicrobium sp. TaxID=2022436 RepID=UPI00404A7A99
ILSMKRKNQNWTEVTITIHEELADVLSEHIISILKRGISVKEAGNNMTYLEAYLSDNDLKTGAIDAITEFVSRLNSMNPDLPKGSWSQRVIKDEDWGQNWKLAFKPIHIGKRFVIKPSWETYKARPDEFIIEIDPGQAFGTGTHQTTAMILEAMETLWQKKGWLENGIAAQKNTLPDVLDAGTGTGILGIGARLLGAANIVCVDIDPVAVETARENMKKNRLKDVVVTDTKLEDIDGRFDVILANLDKNTLIGLSRTLKSLLKNDGAMILSGILTDQKDAVIRTFKAQGMKVEEVMTDLKEAEWVCISLSIAP